ncbi:vegetative cell wall protein gp1-like [Ailuropoda melanoleuca]|uniref:vegetative cell wall protein gp1-like n=1 Tax=Ailuropoda melanoleuca TaxID=9646 RepID=UPI00149501DC|nr:vegetative cell wall protein gp1-like [Ailuropoda melanoleuca]
MSGVSVRFCFPADSRGPCRPGGPILERMEDAVGQPQRPLRQGAVGRGGAAPSRATWLPSPAAPAASPSPPQPVGGRSAGGPGTWAPPSHPHSHPHTHPRARTRAPSSRALSLADTQALRSPRSHPAGQRPPQPSPRARPRQAAASLWTAPPRPPSQPPGPDPLATAATVGTWKNQEVPGGDTRTVPIGYWTYRSRIHEDSVTLKQGFI